MRLLFVMKRWRSDNATIIQPTRRESGATTMQFNSSAMHWEGGGLEMNQTGGAVDLRILMHKYSSSALLPRLLPDQEDAEPSDGEDDNASIYGH